MVLPDRAAWIAGVIEGEGNISWNFVARSPSIQVGMTDRDTIERLREWSGVGTVHQLRKTEGRKQAWRWTISAHGEVVTLLDMIDPWLMSRRLVASARLRALLLEHHAKVTEGRRERSASRRANPCPEGHIGAGCSPTSCWRCTAGQPAHAKRNRRAPTHVQPPSTRSKGS